MTLFEIWLIAIGLAMDCFTVSVASGIVQQRWQGRTALTLAFAFGLFQAFMPLIGWAATHHLHGIIEAYDHWIAFALLAYLGARMIFDGFKSNPEEHHFCPTNPKVVLTLAVATSIDALAVGISFACIGFSGYQEMMLPILIIGSVSALLSLVGYGIGVCFGKRFRFPVEPLGGLILIGIGVRILYEHLLM